MPSVSESLPLPRKLRRIDSIGLALGFAFILVLAVGIFILRNVANDRAEAAREASHFLHIVQRATNLVPMIGRLYAVSLAPAPQKVPTSAASRAKVEEELNVELGDLEKRLLSLANQRDAAELRGNLHGVREAVAALAQAISATPASREAVDAAYNAALKTVEDWEGTVQRVGEGLIEAQDGGAQTFINVEYLVSGTLLLLVLGAALYFRERADREYRIGEEKERLLEQVQAAEVKYHSIFDNSVEGVFQTTPEGRFVTANRALAEIYGYESPEDLIANLTDIPTQLYVDPSQRAALLEALKQEDVVSNFEMEVVRIDGRTIWVRENVRAVRDKAGKLLYLEGSVQDVSSLWWGEQRRQLQYATARVLTEAATVDEARPLLLRTICETLEWDMGAVWDVDPAASVMHCVEIWSVPEVEISAFEDANNGARIRPGEGLAGSVWKTGQPGWIADLKTTDEDYSNATLALQCGMSSAFAVPISVGDQVLHVLEFFSPKISLPDPELLQMLSAIGAQLGQLIERKRSEEALRRSEMRKAAILQSALDSIITFDPDGRISEFNPASERAFGFQQNEAVGRELVSLLFPNLKLPGEQPGLELYMMTNSGSPGIRRELVARRADGASFPVELAISRIVIDGQPMFTAFLHDITERKEAERLTSELALVVADSNDAIIAGTLEGTIRSWNLGAERIFGYTAEEAIGRPLHMLIPQDRLDEFPQSLTSIYRGHSLANYETVRLRKDGRKISVSLTDSPIRGEGGKIIGLSSIARDVTERKRLEEELLQSQKMDAVGRLAGGIAHDFNNILTAILGYSDLIIGQVDERQWMYKHLIEIRKAADFAAALTHQLLAFSRRQPLFLRVFNVNDTVRNMEKMLCRVIGEHIQIGTKLDAKTGRLKADPGQLEQVLLNLCVNARDAMPKGGTITIATEDVTYLLDDAYAANDMPAGEYVRLSVTDSGTGMAEEVKKHIFEPFFTTKEKGQGTGLGLATCYGIVKQTGGYIAVDTAVGRGTTFSIYLPRVEESGEKASIRKEVGQLPGGSETILYVEDEITVRSLTSHVLRRLGYTVLEACDGKQARDLVQNSTNGEIELLFSDVVLPDAGGSELASWMRAYNDKTRILFTSGYVDETILRRHGLEAGTAFLQKPFTPAELARKVRQVMDGEALSI